MKLRVQMLAAAGTALGLTAPAVGAESLLYAPYPYFEFADSPFDTLSFSYFHLEDFEGNERKPGYTIGGGGRILGPSDKTDSVDADDGTIDGRGIAGSSWFSDGTTSVFTITFDAALLTALPTHVGVAWTDVGLIDPGGPPGTAGVNFEAFGPGSSPIGGVGDMLGDGAVDGGTAEDRFFGVENPTGVSSIRIAVTGSVDWEIDHLQYGAINPIPEPEQWLLMALGLGALAWRLGVRKSQAV